MTYNTTNELMYLGFNQEGTIDLQFPQGNIKDNYQLYVNVYIIDNENDKSLYCVNDPIIVKPEDDNLFRVKNQIVNNEESSNFILRLMRNNLQTTTHIVNMLLTSFNEPKFLSYYVIFNFFNPL